MKEIIERKIKDLEETKSDYLEMLEHGSLFDDSYLLNQLRLCNSKIDVLKDVIDEYEDSDKDKEIDKKEQFLGDNIKRLEREVVKKDNIINELEKWLEEQHQFIIEIPAYTKEISIEHKTMEICYENVLDKLQELKGEDKE